MTSLLALKNGQPVAVRKLLGANSWIGLANLANAANAGLVFASFDRLGLVVVLAAVPFVALFLVTIRARVHGAAAGEQRPAALRQREALRRRALRHAAVGMLQGAATTCAPRLRLPHSAGREVGVAHHASQFSQGLSIVLVAAEDAAAQPRPAR